MKMKRPKIFISSTIYDFRDLRSALKYHLEALGFDVQLSEKNDFYKELNINSYKACLKSIENVNYFMLLIGSRVGGYYDKKNKISITQKEYRVAYELMKKGKLKLIILVREELWNLKEDRKSLEKYLKNDLIKTYEIFNKEELVKSVYLHPSKLANDVEFLFEFLNEVGRIQEMINATEGKGAFPVSNWVHKFNKFDDIIDIIKTEFNIKENLSTIALSINLKRELLENLKLLIIKNEKGVIYRNTNCCSGAREYFKGSNNDKSSIPGRQLHSLGIYCGLYTGSSFRMKYQFIDIAIESGTFLKFITSLNTLKSGSMNNALVNLKENIIKVKDMENCFWKDRDNLAKKYLKMPNNNECFLVDNLELSCIFKIFDYQENIIELSKGVIKALNGDEKYLNSIRLNPDGLLGSDEKKNQNKIPTTEYIDLPHHRTVQPHRQDKPHDRHRW